MYKQSYKVANTICQNLVIDFYNSDVQFFLALPLIDFINVFFSANLLAVPMALIFVS